MTDSNAAMPFEACLPTEVWDLIASFLDEHELAQFRQVCQLFDRVGSDARMLQPLYNRLRAIENTLPAELQTAATQAGKSPLIFLKEAFEKIQAKQQQEIAYLTQYHPAMIAKIEYAEVLQQNTSISLKLLEAKNTVLDEMNSEIVTTRIDINRTELHLSNAGITRLRVTPFQTAAHANFWKNLIHLSCSNNQLTALNLQGLVALQTLWCDDNELTTLNLQGLVALQSLWCHNNQLPVLDLQGLVALQTLWCQKNQLTELNLQGLVALETLWCDNNQLTALNLQGLMALQTLLYYNNPLIGLNLTGASVVIKNKHAEQESHLMFKKLSLAGAISSVLPYFSAYQTSGANNNTPANLRQKRSCDKGLPQMEQEKEQGDKYKVKNRNNS